MKSLIKAKRPKFWKLLLILFTIFLAFIILFVSIFRTASVKYDFTSPPKVHSAEELVLGDEDVEIDYYFPYPGRVLPDSPTWPIKAARDKVWLYVTTNPTREAELLLLFADKRIASSKLLFEQEKYELGFTTLLKAEHYLKESAAKEEENRKAGIDTKAFLKRLSKATLKHIEVMNDLYVIAPEDAKPEIIKLRGQTQKVFEKTKEALQSLDMTPPQNPFE